MEFGVVERFALEYIRSHSLAFSFFRYHVTPILFKRTHVSVYILRRECAFIHSKLQTPNYLINGLIMMAILGKKRGMMTA